MTDANRCKVNFNREYYITLCPLKLNYGLEHDNHVCDCSLDHPNYGRELMPSELMELCGQLCHLIMTHLSAIILVDHQSTKDELSELEDTLTKYIDQLKQLGYVSKTPLRKVHVSDVTSERYKLNDSDTGRDFPILCRKIVMLTDPFVLADLIPNVLIQSLAILETKFKETNEVLVIYQSKTRFEGIHEKLRQIMRRCHVKGQDTPRQFTTINVCYMVEWIDKFTRLEQ